MLGSDDFGFDVLGYLAPFVGEDAQPILLEVKNATKRAFIASTAEWRRAQEQGNRYAFLVMIRDSPPKLELIPNPSELLDEGQIRREADSWAISYEPLTGEALTAG